MAVLSRCLSKFKAIQALQHPISRLWDFTRLGRRTSVRLMNRGPASLRPSKIDTRGWFNIAQDRPIIRSHEVSKVWDQCLEFHNRSEIWQASRQHCYKWACQISNPNLLTPDFAPSILCKISWWYVRLMRYGIGPQCVSSLRVSNYVTYVCPYSVVMSNPITVILMFNLGFEISCLVILWKVYWWNQVKP